MPYDNGYYSARINAEAFGDNGNGKPFVALDLEIMGQYEGDDIVDCTPGKCTVRFYFVSDDNARISIEQLRKIGWQGENLDEFNTGSGLVGTTHIMQCTYDGKYHNWKFQATQAGGGGTAKVVTSPTKARELNAKYSKFLKTKPPVAQRAPAAAGAKQPF